MPYRPLRCALCRLCWPWCRAYWRRLYWPLLHRGRPLLRLALYRPLLRPLYRLLWRIGPVCFKRLRACVAPYATLILLFKHWYTVIIYWRPLPVLPLLPSTLRVALIHITLPVAVNIASNRPPVYAIVWNVRAKPATGGIAYPVYCYYVAAVVINISVVYACIAITHYPVIIKAATAPVIATPLVWRAVYGWAPPATAPVIYANTCIKPAVTVTPAQ